MAGFHLIKSVLEKVPNIAAIESQVSEPVISYHATQLLAIPLGRVDGALVTVGGIGRLSNA